MKVLAILRPKPEAKLSDFEPLRLPEEKQIWQLYLQDIVREMYWNAPPDIRVVLILEVDNIEAAKEAISSLPMVKADLFSTEFIALNPWQPLEILFAAK